MPFRLSPLRIKVEPGAMLHIGPGRAQGGLTMMLLGFIIETLLAAIALETAVLGFTLEALLLPEVALKTVRLGTRESTPTLRLLVAARVASLLSVILWRL